MLEITTILAAETLMERIISLAGRFYYWMVSPNVSKKVKDLGAEEIFDDIDDSEEVFVLIKKKPSN